MSDKLVVAPIQRSRLSEQIVIQLCKKIGQGQFRPGDRLPPERELADQLQVSRTSLREALRVMEMAGIVSVRQGGGSYVREFADDGLLSPLLLMLDARGDFVGDLIEVRIIFEPDVAARAAVRATREDLHELERIVHAQEEGVGVVPGDAWLVLDRQFHIAVARASHNEVSVRVTRFITEMLKDARRHFVASDERLRQALSRHQAILTGIRGGDALRARNAMLQHLRDVEEFILQGVVSGGTDAIETPASARTATDERRTPLTPTDPN
jgi:GntR family transcriptional repressor for pyruvate dehydrogenase complex